MAETKHSSAAPPRDEKECYYLFNDVQSARVDLIQRAMRGISSLISNGSVSEQTILDVDRADIAAIFDLFAESLDDAIGVNGRGFAYLNPADIKRSVQ